MISLSAQPKHAGMPRAFVWSALLVWLALVVIASASGWLGQLPPMATPPIAGLTLIVPMALYLSIPGLRRYFASVGLERLTAIHVFRIAAAPLFFWYGSHGLLQPVFVERAAYGDILAGLLALLALTSWRRPAGFWVAHVYGMIDFLTAFGTAIALTRKDPAAMHAVTGLPMALIPFFFVGLLATTHVVVYDLLLRGATPAPSGSIPQPGTSTNPEGQ
jgi:hypothetical protein